MGLLLLIGSYVVLVGVVCMCWIDCSRANRGIIEPKLPRRA